MVLNTKEKKNKDFILLAFDESKDAWNTADRLLQSFKGYYYDSFGAAPRFTVNTFYSLVNLILPNFIFQQPHIFVKPQTAAYLRMKNKGEVEQKDNIQAANNMTAVINHHYNKNKIIFEDRKAIQDALFYPFGVCKNGYDDESGEEYRMRLSPRDFGYHPLATNPDNSSRLVHRAVVSRSKLKGTKLEGAMGVSGEIPVYMQDKTRYKNKSGERDWWSDYVTIFEVHDQESGMIYYYAGEEKKLVHKQEDNLYFNGSHFDIIKFAGDTDEFDGIPMLAMVEDECMAVNEVVTMIVEHLRKFPGQVVAEEGSIDDDLIEKIRTGEQGSIFTVKDISKIIKLPPLSMGIDYERVVYLLNTITDRILGIPDFQRLSGSSRKSATEASYIQGDATVRRNYFLSIVKDFVIDGIEKQSAMKQQFMDKKEVIQASGELNWQVFDVSKEDIQGEYQFDFDIDNMTAANEAQFTNIVNLLHVLSDKEAMHPVLRELDPKKTAKTLFKKAGLNYDAFSKMGIEEVTFISPERENELAKEGQLDRPKKGENHKDHLKVHETKLKEIAIELGPKARSDRQVIQLAEHIVATQQLMAEEEGPKEGPPGEGLQQPGVQGPIGPGQIA